MNKTEYNIQINFKVKTECINAYGGKCVLCGCEDIECLVIDHINDNGYEERRDVSYARKIFWYLRSLGYPKGDYQVLCANCNMRKENERKRTYAREVASKKSTAAIQATEEYQSEANSG